MATLNAVIALLTETELEELLDTTFDTAYANALINSASQFISNFCDRVFIKATYTNEVYDGNGDKELFLRNYPITDASTVTVKTWDTFSDVVDSTLVVNTDYLIYTDEGMIYKRARWYKAHQRYRITYTAGYLVANVPYDLKQACAQICQHLDNNKNNPGAASETIGKYSISYRDSSGALVASVAVPASIIDMLQPYRRISFDEL